MLLLKVVLFLTIIFLALAQFNPIMRRKDKGKKGWSENWEAWTGYCKCEKKCDKKSKKDKTIAITIPKYKFVDIPVAKEIASKGLGGIKSVEIDDYKDDHEDHDEHYI